MQDQGCIGIQCVQTRLRRARLVETDTLAGVQDLALQIAPINHIVVDQGQCPNSGRSEIQRSGRTQPTGTDNQDPALQQGVLSFQADLGQQQMAGVALPLICAQTHRDFERKSFRLPANEAAGYGTNIAVSDREQIVSGQQGAYAAVT